MGVQSSEVKAQARNSRLTANGRPTIVAGRGRASSFNTNGPALLAQVAMPASRG